MGYRVNEERVEKAQLECPNERCKKQPDDHICGACKAQKIAAAQFKPSAMCLPGMDVARAVLGIGDLCRASHPAARDTAAARCAAWAILLADMEELGQWIPATHAAAHT